MGPSLDRVRPSRYQAPQFPPDPGLPNLSRLFEESWIWKVYDQLFDDDGDKPDEVRPRRLAYRPGKRALVVYEARRFRGDWLLEEEFACEVLAGKRGARLFRYPHDPYLPGLKEVASPATAQDVLRRYIRLDPAILDIRLIRYRPSTRAVLRYRGSWRVKGSDRVYLFVRAMRPELISRFLRAGRLVDESDFVIPSLEGYWEEGGIVWLGRLPGKTVREHIDRGTAPDPDMILDRLSSIWALDASEDLPVADISRSIQSAVTVLEHLLQGRPGQEAVRAVWSQLEPFVAGLRPSGIAHNDFYDDQMIVLPSGELGLADFEEGGIGDPMADVANFIAHLRWSSSGPASRHAAYRQAFRARALERFGWDEEELDLHEACCLLRLCTNPARSLRPDWPEITEQRLTLVEEALPGARQALSA